MAERHGRLLGRLAELSLAACEDLAARAAEAEEPKLAADLHVAFAKAGRCLRQTVMLEAKLAQGQADVRRTDQARVRQAQTFAPKPAPDRRDAREAYLAEGLEVEITEQLEGAEREERLERLDDLLETEREKPGFLTEPVAAVALRLCDGLGLTFGARPGPPKREPEPPSKPEPEPSPVTEPEPEPDPPDPPPDPPPPVYTYPWDHPRAQFGRSYGGTGW